MIEEVATHIYRIVIPIPVPFLDSMNVYVAIGPERTLIVDAGMARTQCMETLQAGLKELGVDPQDADFFMTHHHGDHFGLVSRFLTDHSAIYINRLEAALVERIGSRKILAEVSDFLVITGFPELDVGKIIPPRAGDEYRARATWPFRFVEDGDTLDTGLHHFRCLMTPGHSVGHTCLYEPGMRLLLSGDHLLHDITPAIQLRSDRENPLDEYLESLNRLRRLDIDLVLPGHGPIFRNCKERITELEAHHRQSAYDILSVLNDTGQNAYQVASRIPWSIVSAEGWGTLPLLQQFFATGEAFSHLKYLEEKGGLLKEMRGRTLVYSLITPIGGEG